MFIKYTDSLFWNLLIKISKKKNKKLFSMNSTWNVRGSQSSVFILSAVPKVVDKILNIKLNPWNKTTFLWLRVWQLLLSGISIPGLVQILWVTCCCYSINAWRYVPLETVVPLNEVLLSITHIFLVFIDNANLTHCHKWRNACILLYVVVVGCRHINSYCTWDSCNMIVMKCLSFCI